MGAMPVDFTPKGTFFLENLTLYKYVGMPSPPTTTKQWCSDDSWGILRAVTLPL